MTHARCIGEPISWLRIERYVLGELSASDAGEVRAHLDRCPVCRACVDEATAPRVLPALPGLAPKAAVSSPTPLRLPRRIAIAASTFAAAAAVAIVVMNPTHVPHTTGPSSDVRVRGGDVALVVLREHDGEVVENPAVFATRDRFRVAVTCPPGHDEHVRVYVVQGDDADLALQGGARFRCGNRVVLEGAFRITDEADAHVCAVFGEPPPVLEDIALARSLLAGDGDARCRALRIER